MSGAQSDRAVISFSRIWSRTDIRNKRADGMRITLKARVMAAAVLLLLTVPALAKPKTKTYTQGCDVVWPAVKKAVTTQHYNFANMDDATKKGMVSTGNNWSGKRYLDITVTAPSGGGCMVAIGGQYSGIVHNDKGDLFSRIDEALAAGEAAPAAVPAAPAAATAPAAHPE